MEEINENGGGIISHQSIDIIDEEHIDGQNKDTVDLKLDQETVETRDKQN